MTFFMYKINLVPGRCKTIVQNYPKFKILLEDLNTIALTRWADIWLMEKLNLQDE